MIESNRKLQKIRYRSVLEHISHQKSGVELGRFFNLRIFLGRFSYAKRFLILSQRDSKRFTLVVALFENGLSYFRSPFLFRIVNFIPRYQMQYFLPMPDSSRPGYIHFRFLVHDYLSSSAVVQDRTYAMLVQVLIL